MIETSLKLGRNLIGTNTEIERKDKFLKSQALIPRALTDDKATGNREIVIDLDTENQVIDLYLGDELVPDNRDKFFAFESFSPNSKKIYFATNNFYYHIYSLDEMIIYIQENMDNCYPEFADYLIEIRQQFYLKNGKGGWYLNPDKLTESFKKRLYEYADGQNDKDTVEDAFTELVSKDILGSTRKPFAKKINICTLKIDGIRAHDSNFPFSKEYVDIVYYERQKRFFDNSESMVRQNANCSGCHQEKKVTGKIDIPTKFYITDKPTFFEKLEEKNSYRSFALCEDCYQELMIGIDYIRNKYSSNLFGTNYYLIPRTLNIQNLDEKMYFIKEKLLGNPKNLADEVENHRDLIEEMKEENLRFDFLFHWTPPGQGAAFVVAEYISDVEYVNIDKIFKTLRSFKLGFYSALDAWTAGLSHIYWLLFPNRESHSNPDPNLYRKELLHAFKVLMKNGTLSYRTLINKFLFIFKKTKYRKQDLDLSFFMRPLQMHILLSLFHEHTNLQGLNTMNSQKKYTKISDEKIQAFFETHPEIYQGNQHRQGLVLLGVLMNQILKKQNKQSKSATIIDKMNFDGMPVRRLPKFVNEITEYLNLKTYDLYRVNSVLHAAMMDRVQNIENSTVSKDEVVFYIMTGISLSSYLGYQYNQEQKAEVTNE